MNNKGSSHSSLLLNTCYQQHWVYSSFRLDRKGQTTTVQVVKTMLMNWIQNKKIWLVVFGCVIWEVCSVAVWRPVVLKTWAVGCGVPWGSTLCTRVPNVCWSSPLMPETRHSRAVSFICVVPACFLPSLQSIPGQHGMGPLLLLAQIILMTSFVKKTSPWACGWRWLTARPLPKQYNRGGDHLWHTGVKASRFFKDDPWKK